MREIFYRLGVYCLSNAPKMGGVIDFSADRLSEMYLCAVRHRNKLGCAKGQIICLNYGNGFDFSDEANGGQPAAKKPKLGIERFVKEVSEDGNSQPGSQDSVPAPAQDQSL